MTLAAKLWLTGVIAAALLVPAHAQDARIDQSEDDQYRVCFDPDGAGRPVAIASKGAGCRILHVWKRAKP